MRTLPAVLALAAVAAGCRLMRRDHPPGAPALLHPAARYCETVTRPPRLRDLFARGAEPDGDVVRRAQAWLGRDHPMLADPFVTGAVTRVRFWLPETLDQVLGYYRLALAAEPWTPVEGADDLSDCNCDAYVFGTFRNGPRSFRLYTYTEGSPEDGMRYVVFEFVNTPPEDVLGARYRGPRRDE